MTGGRAAWRWAIPRTFGDCHGYYPSPGALSPCDYHRCCCCCRWQCDLALGDHFHSHLPHHAAAQKRKAAACQRGWGPLHAALWAMAWAAALVAVFVYWPSASSASAKGNSNRGIEGTITNPSDGHGRAGTNLHHGVFLYLSHGWSLFRPWLQQLGHQCFQLITVHWRQRRRLTQQRKVDNGKRWQLNSMLRPSKAGERLPDSA